jgi:hypothetical protein
MTDRTEHHSARADRGRDGEGQEGMPRVGTA